MRILLVAVLLFVLINVGYVYWLFDSHTINIWEIRFYIIYVILIGIVTCFGVLRIYNAVVSNTRFLLLLRKDMQTFSTTAKDFSRDVQKYIKQLSGMKTAITNLTNKITNKK